MSKWATEKLAHHWSKRGISPWNKGKRLSGLHRTNLSKAMVGRISPKRGKPQPQSRIQVNLSPSPILSYILGVMKGDGYINHNRKAGAASARLDATNITFVQEFGRALENIGLHSQYCQRSPRNGRKPVFVVMASSVNFANWYQALSSEDLNQIAFAYPKEFLRGFFQAEGCIHYQYGKFLEVKIGNTNEALLSFYQQLIREVGCDATLRLAHKANQYHEGHSAYFNLDLIGGRAGKEKFLKLIGCQNGKFGLRIST